MKLFYVCPFESTKALTCEWHGIDLENGKWLIAVRWRNDVDEAGFAKDPNVVVLPHPIFEADHALPDEHIAHVSHLFTELKAGDNVHHLLRSAAKLSPAFRLRVL